jgi:hypothetical protein
VSNAPKRAALRRLLRVAFTRWNVEHSFRLSKGEMGFRHFEGQNYVALMRHLVLCCVTLTFVAGEASRLRGEKSGGDRGAGVPGAGGGVPGVAGGPAGDESAAVHVGGHWLPPAALPGGTGVTAAAATWRARRVHEAGGALNEAPPGKKKMSETAKSSAVAL